LSIDHSFYGLTLYYTLHNSPLDSTSPNLPHALLPPPTFCKPAMVKQSLGPKKGLNRKESVAKHVKASTAAGVPSSFGRIGEEAALDIGGTAPLMSTPAADKEKDAAARGGVLGGNRSMVFVLGCVVACLVCCVVRGVVLQYLLVF